MKKQDENDEDTLKPQKNVIEDYQVQTDETNYGDWLIAQGLVALSQEPEVKPAVVPKPMKKNMQNAPDVTKVIVPEDERPKTTGNQGVVDNEVKP